MSQWFLSKSKFKSGSRKITQWVHSDIYSNEGHLMSVPYITERKPLDKRGICEWRPFFGKEGPCIHSNNMSSVQCILHLKKKEEKNFTCFCGWAFWKAHQLPLKFKYRNWHACALLFSSISVYITTQCPEAWNNLATFPLKVHQIEQRKRIVNAITQRKKQHLGDLALEEISNTWSRNVPYMPVCINVCVLVCMYICIYSIYILLYILSFSQRISFQLDIPVSVCAC